MQLFKHLFLFIAGSVLLTACGIYSFTGASIPNEAKTVSVQYFNNKAATVQATLSQVFTEKLKDIFVEQTNLTLSEDEGDLSFTGHISKYQINPIAIQSNETASKNRLTIEVNVAFKSTIDTKTNFEQIFSRYSDYNSSDNISEIEETLIDEISKELVEDIFNKAVVNW
jgi:hypothetical protein